MLYPVKEDCIEYPIAVGVWGMAEVNVYQSLALTKNPFHCYVAELLATSQKLSLVVGLELMITCRQL